jgi:TM2 domain-containing membrane protein YozV
MYCLSWLVADKPAETEGPAVLPHWDGDMAICKACDRGAKNGASSCDHRGAAQVGTPIRDQTRAVLLASFLGDFGIHHFYLGRPLLGLLYLLFFWTGIPGVLGSLEAYRFAFMPRDAWADRYNGGRLGKPVPRWLPVALVAVPFAILIGLVAMIHAGYDF